MKILVPVDGSKNSLNAVQFIGSRKTLLGSEPKIELLNVQLPLLYFSSTTVTPLSPSP